MKTPTIYDIKYSTQEKQSLFFSRGAMKFFGQTMKDFSVKKSPAGRIFIYAPISDNYRTSKLYNKILGYTFKEFVSGDLVTVYNENGSMASHNTCADILNFISSH